MSVRCPQCSSVSSLVDRDLGQAGRMVRCSVCGTRWLARSFADDPFGEHGFSRAAHAGQAVEDGLIIEHVGAGFRRAASKASAVRFPTLPRLDPRLLRRLAAIFGAFFVVVALRAPIVAALPNLPGGLSPEAAALEFTGVRSQTVDRRGASTLLVEGTIVNTASRDVALPQIRVTLRSSDGAPVTSWLVQPAVQGLAPGGSIGFRSAVASPPQEATQVTLDLAGRQGS
jgi:predicted Zn finger-like uncharacterized protein